MKDLFEFTNKSETNASLVYDDFDGSGAGQGNVSSGRGYDNSTGWGMGAWGSHGYDDFSGHGDGTILSCGYLTKDGEG